MQIGYQLIRKIFSLGLWWEVSYYWIIQVKLYFIILLYHKIKILDPNGAFHRQSSSNIFC